MHGRPWNMFDLFFFTPRELHTLVVLGYLNTFLVTIIPYHFTSKRISKFAGIGYSNKPFSIASSTDLIINNSDNSFVDTMG